MRSSISTADESDSGGKSDGISTNGADGLSMTVAVQSTGGGDAFALWRGQSKDLAVELLIEQGEFALGGCAQLSLTGEIASIGHGTALMRADGSDKRSGCSAVVAIPRQVHRMFTGRP